MAAAAKVEGRCRGKYAGERRIGGGEQCQRWPAQRGRKMYQAGVDADHDARRGDVAGQFAEAQWRQQACLRNPADDPGRALALGFVAGRQQAVQAARLQLAAEGGPMLLRPQLVVALGGGEQNGGRLGSSSWDAERWRRLALRTRDSALPAGNGDSVVRRAGDLIAAGQGGKPAIALDGM